ncbi:MAG: MATE family efflux transporter [Myxococcales bacterium]|nr:MATE family efflux transporter [Myxococcales bacterium]
MTEVRRLASLAWPVVLGQLGLVGMGAVDLLMIGGLGRDATAAVGLGNTWSFAAVIVGLGAATGIDTAVTQAYGRGAPREAGFAAVQGLQLVLLLAVPVVGLHLLAEPALRLLSQPEEVIPLAATYARIMAWSMVPMLAFSVVRQLLQGGGAMRPGMWVVGIGNVVNVLGNLALIGSYGIAGVAWSTVIVRWSMLLALLVLGARQLRVAWPSRPWIDGAALMALAATALPVGAQVGLEVWAFNASMFVAGWLGPDEVAAHAASINAVALSFMTASGLSAAAATRVGNLVGAGAAWQGAARAALGMGVCAMACTGSLFLLFPEVVGRAYNADPTVVALCAQVLPIGAFFGLFDGSQVVAFGILRGLGDTRTPTLFNLLGYWLLGLPLGAALAFWGGLGLVGVWLGLALGLMVIATLLVVRIVGHGRRYG